MRPDIDMRIYLILILSFALKHTLFSQGGSFEIKGQILSADDSRPIKNAQVRLSIPTTDTLLESISNDRGEYSFRVPKSYSVVVITVQTTIRTSAGKKGEIFRFLDTDSKITFSQAQVYTKDFFLTPIIVDPALPSLYFQQNSTELFWDKSAFYWGEKSADEAFDFYAKILTDNPEIVIEINAYCDSTEKRVKRLSMKRAKYVKKQLVKRNVPADRILVSGKGIDNSKYNGETNDVSRQKNRQAFVKIIRFDYNTNRP